MDSASKALLNSTKKEIVPPGTVKFKKKLYADMTPPSKVLHVRVHLPCLS